MVPASATTLRGSCAGGTEDGDRRAANRGRGQGDHGQIGDVQQAASAGDDDKHDDGHPRPSVPGGDLPHSDAGSDGRRIMRYAVQRRRLLIVVLAGEIGDHPQ
jgi:hypothetical protein